MTRIVMVRVALMNDERWVVGVVDREVEGVEGRGCLIFWGGYFRNSRAAVLRVFALILLLCGDWA